MWVETVTAIAKTYCKRAKGARMHPAKEGSETRRSEMKHNMTCGWLMLCFIVGGDSEFSSNSSILPV